MSTYIVFFFFFFFSLQRGHAQFSRHLLALYASTAFLLCTTAFIVWSSFCWEKWAQQARAERGFLKGQLNRANGQIAVHAEQVLIH
jgi:hypothetical protein